MNEDVQAQTQGGDQISQILQIVGQNNQMIQQIGQMMQQMLEVAQGAVSQDGGQGGGGQDEALRQEAIARLQQQQGA